MNQVVERGVRDDHLDRETNDGREELVRTVVASAPDGSIRESIRVVVDGATFAPIRTEWRGGGRFIRVRLPRPEHRRGLRINEPGARRKDCGSVWQPAFDYYGGMTDLFLATLPPGRRLFVSSNVVTGARAPRRTASMAAGRALGDDVARGAGKDIKAWRVEANTPYGFYKVWVTDRRHMCVRHRHSAGPRHAHHLRADVRAKGVALIKRGDCHFSSPRDSPCNEAESARYDWPGVAQILQDPHSRPSIPNDRLDSPLAGRSHRPARGGHACATAASEQ